MSITCCYSCQKEFADEKDARVRFNAKIRQNVIFHKECEGTIDWSVPPTIPNCALCGKEFQERFAIIDLKMAVLFHKTCIGDRS